MADPTADVSPQMGWGHQPLRDNRTASHCQCPHKQVLCRERKKRNPFTDLLHYGKLVYANKKGRHVQQKYNRVLGDGLIPKNTKNGKKLKTRGSLES
jgi:hypothetical protein